MIASYHRNAVVTAMARNRTRGSVLVLVLWVSLGLVALALTFGHSMMMTYRGTDNDLAGRQADQATEGAARYAQMLLQNAEKPGEFPDIATYTSEAVPVGEATFWFLGHSSDDETGTTQVFGLVDEASKLNLNTASAAMLEGLPGMTAELAAAIVDWRDSNEEITESGAESETYMLRQPSYAAKNAPFESVEELALVNGADPYVLYGEDTNLNGVLDPNEDDGSKTLPDDNSNGQLDFGILQYVTAFSSEPTTQSDGTTPRVNVSAANARADLDALIRQKLPSRADAIISALGTNTIRSVTEFFIRGALTAEEQSQIAPEITDQYGPRGRVNVNTASESVLACIPGIGTDKAASLVAARQNRAEKGTSFAWAIEALGQEAAIQAGRYITGSSYQVSADVAAVGRHGRGYRRIRFVIDMSTGAPRIIYRRNLSPLGWALGSDVRQTLAARKEMQ